jgi:L-threonylcarbamoyladenylate synthase
LKKMQGAELETLSRKAVEILLRPGAVLLLPTETVYGLVCRASDEAACRKLFELKQRPASKVIGWFVSGSEMLEKYGVILDARCRKLLERYTPGALTVIAPTASGLTQGFRIPDHPLLEKILELLGEPLAQTSANASGNPDAANCADALAQLNGNVDFHVDGGAVPDECCASTVVDASGVELKILRQGSVFIDNNL